MKSRSFTARLVGWSIVMAIAVVSVGLLTKRVAVRSTEISATRSPDGTADAVLLDVPQDAHGAHSVKVCLRRPATAAYGQPTCSRIAYLAGLPPGDRDSGIRLEWTSPTELEIRYREATTVYLFYPTFIWPYSGVRALRPYASGATPIHTRLVQTKMAPEAVSTN